MVYNSDNAKFSPPNAATSSLSLPPYQPPSIPRKVVDRSLPLPTLPDAHHHDLSSDTRRRRPRRADRAPPTPPRSHRRPRHADRASCARFRLRRKPDPHLTVVTLRRRCERLRTIIDHQELVNTRRCRGLRRSRSLAELELRQSRVLKGFALLIRWAGERFELMHRMKCIEMDLRLSHISHTLTDLTLPLDVLRPTYTELDHLTSSLHADLDHLASSLHPTHHLTPLLHSYTRPSL